MAESSQHSLQIMENKTRFDLNTALENWRQELVAQPALTPDDRRELETHLCDVLAELKARGVSDEEAFHLARRRLGHPQKLAEEFTQANPAQVWRERIFWGWLVFFLYETWSGAATSVSFAFVRKFDWLQHQHQFNGVAVNDLILPCGYMLIGLGVPVILVMSLATGKWVPQFSKLKLWLENRRRLLMVIVGCFVISNTCRMVAAGLFPSNIHWSTPDMRTAVFINNLLILNLHSIITASLLLWLQPRKTPQPLKIA
jgi:hypothetical protein